MQIHVTPLRIGKIQAPSFVRQIPKYSFPREGAIRPLKYPRRNSVSLRGRCGGRGQVENQPRPVSFLSVITRRLGTRSQSTTALIVT